MTNLDAQWLDELRMSDGSRHDADGVRNGVVVTPSHELKPGETRQKSYEVADDGSYTMRTVTTDQDGDESFQEIRFKDGSREEIRVGTRGLWVDLDRTVHNAEGPGSDVEYRFFSGNFDEWAKAKDTPESLLEVDKVRSLLEADYNRDHPEKYFLAEDNYHDPTLWR